MSHPTRQSPNPLDTVSGHTSSRELMARLVKDYVRPHGWRIVAAITCMVITAAATAAYAKILEPVLDDVFVNHDIAMITILPFIVIGIAVTNGLADLGQAYFMEFVGLRIVADLQKRMFRRVVGADMAFFSHTPTGMLITRFTTDANLVRQATSSTLTGIVKDSLTLIFLVGLMIYQDWQLAAVSLVAFPLAILPVVALGRRMRRVTSRSQVEIGSFASMLTETIQGVAQVKTAVAEERETERAGAIIERLFKLYLKSVITRSLSSPIMETLAGSAVAAVIYFGGIRVIAGETTPGIFFSVITALLLAYRPIKSLARLNSSLQEGLAAAQRVFHVLDLEPEIRDRPDASPLMITRGEIRFAHVKFAYGGDGPPALNGIDLTIPAGKRVALVGPSGAGKTTILNLIPRFYDPVAGRIDIDGTDIRDVMLASLRGQIALVSQEVFLFNDTVRANIAYARPDAPDDTVIAAAQNAAAHDFITALPNGYDTIIGERGITLSGGQRQRLSIARAILKDAPILLLDEATSSLDTESERAVQSALDRLMAGRTALVIAHRLSTVHNADLICVINQGDIVETGTHEQLLAQTGLYSRLHAMQFKDWGAVASDKS